jgi:hypothetical protein
VVARGAGPGAVGVWTGRIHSTRIRGQRPLVKPIPCCRPIPGCTIDPSPTVRSAAPPPGRRSSPGRHERCDSCACAGGPEYWPRATEASPG